MEHIKKTIDDGFRRIRGKIELVKKPHVGVKEWLETHIPTASSSLMSLTTLNEQSNSASSTTSGPSTCSNTEARGSFSGTEMPAKPSRFLSINVELLDVFEDDNGPRMRVILEKGLDPNFVDMNGKPLIYRAVEEKKYNILDTMLDFGFGCDINSTCQNDVNCGWAALHLACHVGDLRAVEILLGVLHDQSHRRDACDVNAVDVDGRNPLHILALSKSWIATAEGSYSSRHSTSDAPPNHPASTRSGQTSPFSPQRSTSQSSPFTPSTGHIRSKRMDSSDTTPTDSGHVFNFEPIESLHSDSPFDTRGSSNEIHQMHQSNQDMNSNQNTDSIIMKSNDITMTKPDTTTAFAACSISKPKENQSQRNHSQATYTKENTRSSARHLSSHAQIMKLLIKTGCDVNRLDEYNGTPMHICSSRGNLEGVKMLLKYGSDPGLVDNICETPLVKAILHLHPAVVRALLKIEHGMSDIKRYELSELLLTLVEEVYNNRGHNTEKKVVEIIKILLRKRIYLNVADSRRRTPLHLACLYCVYRVARTLVTQPSCDVTKQDDEGFAPLFLLTWNPKKLAQSTGVFETLIARGACVNQYDNCGVYPVNAALESGQYLYVKALLAHGSHVDSDRWFCASVDSLRTNSSTLPLVERFVLSFINQHHFSPCLLEAVAILGRRDIMEQLIKAGADRTKIHTLQLQRWIQSDSTEYIMQDLMDNIRVLTRLCMGALSLKDLCRIRIRAHFDGRLQKCIGKLPLPEVLQDHLKMCEYYEHWEDD